MTRANKGSTRKSNTFFICNRARAGAGWAYHSVNYQLVEDALLKEREHIVRDMPHPDAHLAQRLQDSKVAVHVCCAVLHAVGEGLSPAGMRAGTPDRRTGWTIRLRWLFERYPTMRSVAFTEWYNEEGRARVRSSTWHTIDCVAAELPRSYPEYFAHFGPALRRVDRAIDRREHRQQQCQRERQAEAVLEGLTERREITVLRV
jgi:hypothetical protein